MPSTLSGLRLKPNPVQRAGADIVSCLASSPVRYSRRFPHTLSHGKLCIYQICEYPVSRPTSGRIALLQVRRCPRTFHPSCCPTQHTIPRSVICTITLVLTIMITSTGESIRNTASQYVTSIIIQSLAHLTILRSLVSIRLHLWYVIS